MADMTQKDSTTLVVNGSGMSRVGFTGYDAPRVIFPSGVAKPRMLCILAGMPRRTVPVTCTRLVMLVAMHLALFSFFWFAGP